MKILIVEDEMIISEDIRMMLEERNYTITGQAVDYDDALELFNADLPDLVLLDINLKGIKTGIDVARSLNEKCKVPIIYTSSLSDSETIERVKETKPSAYLVKPFKEEQLVTAIEIALMHFANQNSAINETEKLAIFNDSIFVKNGHGFVKVLLSDITYIHKVDNYVDVYTSSNRYTVRSSISGFIEQLNYDRIYRTHKSYAINLDYISDFRPTAVLLDNIEVPLSKVYSDNLKSRLRIF